MGIMRGLMSLCEELARRAEDELYDEEGAKSELVALHKSLESGALDEAEFERREAELLTRLATIAAHKRKRGGP